MLGEEFIFLSNRGSKNFAAALQPLGGRPFEEADKQIDLLYFDTYGGKTAPEVPVGFHLIDRRQTIPLDHKSQMASLLQLADINDPRVYFEPEDVPLDPDLLWIVKNPLLTGGKELYVVPRGQVAEYWEPGNIIQEVVQDLLLIDEKKFTLRMYLLVHDGNLYFYPEGFAVIHAARYVHDSCDPQVQFVHKGYMSPDSSIELRPLSSIPQHEAILAKLPDYLASMFVAFADFLNKEGSDTYCLFGIDLLVRRDLSSVLIEINDRPNLVHTSSINEGVNIPMLRSMYCVLDSSKAALLGAQEKPFEFISEL